MKQFRHKNVFEEIKNKSHDEDWIGLPSEDGDRGQARDRRENRGDDGEA